MKLLDVVRATLRTTFPPRFELRVPRFFFDLRFVAAKSPQITQNLCANEMQDRTARLRQISRIFVGQALRLPASATESGCPTVNRNAALRASHVGAGAGVDLDRFAFLDEKRHVNGLAGFELCRLGDVTGSVAAQTFR